MTTLCPILYPTLYYTLYLVSSPHSGTYVTNTGQTRTDVIQIRKRHAMKGQERAFGGISCMQDRKLYSWNKEKEITNLGQKQKRKEREETCKFVRKGREKAPWKDREETCLFLSGKEENRRPWKDKKPWENRTAQRQETIKEKKGSSHSMLYSVYGVAKNLGDRRVRVFQLTNTTSFSGKN